MEGARQDFGEYRSRPHPAIERRRLAALPFSVSENLSRPGATFDVCIRTADLPLSGIARRARLQRDSRNAGTAPGWRIGRAFLGKVSGRVSEKRCDLLVCAPD